MFGKTFTHSRTYQGFLGLLAVAVALSQLLLTPALVAERTAHAESATTTTTNSSQSQQTGASKGVKPNTGVFSGTITGTYFYYVPIVANQSSTGYTTYLTIQNTGSFGASGAAGTQSANITIKYYDGNGSVLSSVTNTLAPFADWLPTNPFAAGQANGSAEVDSNQPLIISVSTITPDGSGSYTVPMGANAYGGGTLPIFANNAFPNNKGVGITTRFYLYNPNNFPIEGGFTAYSQYGTVSSQTGPFNTSYDYLYTIQPHQTYIFDPSTNPIPDQYSFTKTPMPSGYYGYGTFGEDHISTTYDPPTPTNPVYPVALMQEYRPTDHFTTFYQFNGLNEHQSSTLYIPGIFKNAYGGFYTGMVFSPGNNNNSNQIVTVNFYDTTGKQVATVQSSNLYYGSTYSIYTGSISQLPDGFAGSAIATISSPYGITNPGSMEVLANIEGPTTANGLVRNGVFMGLNNDFNSHNGTGYQLPFPYNAPNSPQILPLPVMANGAFGGFYTGTTIQNLLSEPVTFTLTYQNPDGSQVAGTSTKTYTLQALGSMFIYQGSASEGLPANWFGTAVIKVLTPLPAPVGTTQQPYPTSGPYFALMAQTNVQSATGFYTYSVPGSIFQ